MMKSIGWTLAVALLCPSTARAAAILLRPDAPLSAAPGETLGWGYDVSADADRDLAFVGSFIDLPADSGDVFDLFDFPYVPAGTSVQRDYDPSGPFGLLELTLSPLLSPGDMVIGRVFLDFLLIDPLGVEPEEPGVFELEVIATVTSPAAVPEPTSLLLLGAGLVALASYRRVRDELSSAGRKLPTLTSWKPR